MQFTSGIFVLYRHFFKWPTNVFLKGHLHLGRYVHEHVYNSPKSLLVIACTVHCYYKMIETEIMVAQMSCKVFSFLLSIFLIDLDQKSLWDADSNTQQIKVIFLCEKKR